MTKTSVELKLEEKKGT